MRTNQESDLAMQSSAYTNTLTRKIKSGERSARSLKDVTVWNGIAYVAGIIPPDNSLSIAVQTAEALAIIDGHLAAAGTDKSRLLTALIHMTDVNRDVAEFNAAWSAWLTPGRLPIRTCVEAGLQGGAYFRVTVTAAMPLR